MYKYNYIDAIPKMTSNTTPSGVASASVEHNEYYRAFYAFDKIYGYDQETWATVQRLPQWICYEFPTPKCIKRLITVNRNEDLNVGVQHNNRAVSEFTFQASNDGTTWVNLGTFTSPSSASHYKNTYDIQNDNKYLYYRLYITGNFNNATGTGCGFAEIEMYEGERIPIAGNINAIRDWFNWSRYCKDDVDSFFINGYNEGLVAYNTSIRGLPDDIVILEGDTSEKVYKVKLNSDGKAKRLLFFDNSEDLDVTMKPGNRTISLSSHNPVIRPICYNLIPAMTSNTTPSGEASATSVLNTNFQAYMSMNGIDCNISTLQGCWLARASDSKPCITYDFKGWVFADTLQLDLVNNGPTVQKELFIEGSLNNTDWFNLLDDGYSITKTFTRSAHESFYTPLNWSKCRYIRIRCNEPLYGGANQYACGFNTIQVIGVEDT